MASNQFVAPVVNFLQTTLNGAITNAVGTITLNSTTSMQAPGYVIIDRTDSAGTSTPNAREVVFFTGISGSDLTGCTRGADGSTARSHSDGAVVETMPTTGMFNSLATVAYSALDGSGYLRAISSPVSIAIGRFTQFDTPSIASISRVESPFLKASSALLSIVTISGHLNVSGASISGIGLHPVWYMPGFASAASTNVQRMIMPQAGTFQFFTMMTRTPVSTASLTIDINRNNTSIFDAGTRPSILGGGTFVSTASILTKNFNAGDIMNVDIDTGGNVADITLIGRAA